MKYLIDEIQHLKPKIETYHYKNIVQRYSVARGGNKLIGFSHNWQPYAWAAILGFLNNRSRKVDSPISSFGDFGILNGKTGSPKIFKSLLMLVIAKDKEWKQFLLDPGKFLNVIDEYANGGFDYISEMLNVKGEKYFDEFENFLREIVKR